ncbi:hypothetical protein M405DRAFT_858958 [Rhizopogon salebrosus TDB-379]|nr:hypothetical protein M405DRAFT_858958 [Rhizopogon salebrosus TDB-379]
MEKSIVNGKPIAAHIYEYTTQISVYPSMKIEGAEKGVVPVQRLFCLKERNQNKINSYHWFFNAFGLAIQCSACSATSLNIIMRSPIPIPAGLFQSHGEPP